MFYYNIINFFIIKALLLSFILNSGDPAGYQLCRKDTKTFSFEFSWAKEKKKN